MSQLFSVQFATDKRLATIYGHVILFKAFEPKEVPEGIYRQAIAEGGIDGNMKISIEKSQKEAAEAEAAEAEAEAAEAEAAKHTQTDPNSDEGIGEVEGTGTDSGVLKVAQICRDIIDSADMDKLTAGNKPKLSELSSAAGFTVSAELRDEAMKMVEDGIV